MKTIEECRQYCGDRGDYAYGLECPITQNSGHSDIECFCFPREAWNLETNILPVTDCMGQSTNVLTISKQYNGNNSHCNGPHLENGKGTGGACRNIIRRTRKWRWLTLRRPTCQIWHNEIFFIFHGSAWTAMSKRWKYPLFLNRKDLMKIPSVPQDHYNMESHGSHNNLMKFFWKNYIAYTLWCLHLIFSENHHSQQRQKRRLKFSESSDPTLTVCARSGSTGTWAYPTMNTCRWKRPLIIMVF